MRKLNYLFEFEDGEHWEFELHFDEVHRLIPRPAQHPARPWTLLNTHKCPHCPLRSSEHPQCPVARNLDPVVEDSKRTLSCRKARLTATTEDRVCRTDRDTQEGLRSLFGAIMASSGCPHLDWLRPLARFHLPFASIEETFFRVLSLQLVGQYFEGTLSSPPDSMRRLQERYKAVERVNHAFIGRLRSYCEADADKNALAALDVFVQLFPFELQSDFESLRPYFKTAG